MKEPEQRTPATRRGRIKRWMALLLCGYLAILVLLMLMETEAVYPAPKGGSADATKFGAEDVVIKSPDGTVLHAWYFEKTGTTHTLVFFHGNGESIEWTGPWLCEYAQTLNANAFIFDYRGYGKSEGRPFEKGIVEDGVASIKWLEKRTGQTSDQFVYFGRSLGGGVAIQVARTRKPKAFILVSTFSSIVDVASRKFPWLPVRLVMRNRYESEESIVDIDVPLLQIHGDRDRMIPIELGKQLHAASPAIEKKFVTATGHGHNGLPLEKFRSEIVAFLRRLE